MLSREAPHIRDVRAVYGIRRVATHNRDDCLLAWVTPAISAALPTLTFSDLQLVVLASRHGGETLFPVTVWPTDVYVDRLLGPVPEDGVLTFDAMQQIGWATIYPTRDAAQNWVWTRARAE